ncbi:MAG: N-acetylmuramoyl-L-alanine amidase [Bacteroidales bacterium]|nr:N-acetylmuramoyl-L-alanine amidase [Bacteroidales bacterium]MBN2697415.1 N-acetylmuramoyl-L-alanine amidase [Bacteroidales bacterium]
MFNVKVIPISIKRLLTLFLILTILTCSSFLIVDPELKSSVKSRIQTVVIDAGHGGKDSGALGSRAKEKDIALNIALKLGAYIEDNIRDVKVVYTRKTDVYLELGERARIANENEADLFISIHVNANESQRPFGTSTHILGMNQEGQNLDVAIRENSVILMEEDYQTRYEGFDPTSAESYIMFSLMQNTYLKQSIEFGSLVQDQFRERAQRNDRGVIRQPLLVLRETAMPGVLIETGFITNPKEQEYLLTDDGQNIIASAIFRAFRDYKELIESRSRFEYATPEKEEEIVTMNAETASDQIIFKVQVASSRNKVPASPASFKGYNDIEIIEEGRWYKYVLGNSADYNKALEQCVLIKKDFPDAFVIAVKEGRIIPLGEALIEINK